MTLETLLTYALRLWLAGLLHSGVALLRIGPFGVTCAGFIGWQAAHREPAAAVQLPGDAPEETPAPAFTLR